MSNSDTRNYGTMDLHLHGEQDIEPRYFPPNSHEYMRDEYGRLGIRGHGAGITLYFEDRAQVAALCAALAGLVAEWPEPEPEPAVITAMICRICQTPTQRSTNDGTPVHADYMTRAHDHTAEPVPYTGPSTPPAHQPGCGMAPGHVGACATGKPVSS